MSKLKRNLIIALVVISALVILALTTIITHVDSISDPYTNEQDFERATFAGQWPFTVESVVIRCDKTNGHSVITMTLPTGDRYLLNTDQVSVVDALSAPELTPQNDIWLDTPIADNDHNTPSNQTVAYQKVPLKDIISAGLTLCHTN